MAIVVEGVAEYHGSSTAPHSVTMPASIQAGELLLGWFCWGFAEGAFGYMDVEAAGWTSFGHVNSANNVGGCWAYKVATGSEGASVSFGNDTGGDSADDTLTCVMMRLSGYDTGEVPEAAATALTTSTAPDSPNITPAAGSGDYAIFSSYAIKGNVAVTVAPSGYTEIGQIAETTTGAHNNYVAHKNISGTAENPGAGTIASSVAWFASTCAVKAAGGGGATIPIMDHYSRMQRAA
jgi:hypothetical protein